MTYFSSLKVIRNIDFINAGLFIFISILIFVFVKYSSFEMMQIKTLLRLRLLFLAVNITQS